MHAYRDALPHVRSARVLYPGTVRRDFPALEPGAARLDGVGAIPRVPGAPFRPAEQAHRTRGRWFVLDARGPRRRRTGPCRPPRRCDDSKLCWFRRTPRCYLADEQVGRRPREWVRQRVETRAGAGPFNAALRFAPARFWAAFASATVAPMPKNSWVTPR